MTPQKLHKLLERILLLFYFFKYRYFMKFQTRQKLEAWQQQKLLRFLPWLKQHSPFYQNRLHGPWDSPENIIDKATMMTHFNTLNTAGLDKDHALELAIRAEQSRDFSPMIGDITIGLSSGTSGSRGLFCANAFERAQYGGAILAKALPRGGWKRAQRVAFFLRANSNLYETVGSTRLKFQFFDLLKPLHEHVARLNVYQPTLIIGPPSLLRLLAGAIEAHELSLTSVERIYSVAEVLDPIDRMPIERAFGQKVHQIYQCTEGFLAITCEHGEIHLNEEMVIIEKEWLNFEQRKFIPIVTDLNRRTQPIVRYRLNDILTENPETCPCGSVMTRLKWIEGRSDDMIYFSDPITRSWRGVFPDFVRNAILFSSEDLTEYLVTQRPDGQLEIALRGENIPAMEASVINHLGALAGRLHLELPKVVFRHHFPDLKTTKLRRIMSQFEIVSRSADVLALNSTRSFQ